MEKGINDARDYDARVGQPQVASLLADVLPESVKAERAAELVGLLNSAIARALRALDAGEPEIACAILSRATGAAWARTLSEATTRAIRRRAAG